MLSSNPLYPHALHHFPYHTDLIIYHAQAVERARIVVNRIEAPPILSDTLKSGADTIQEQVVKPIEIQKVELKKKMGETMKEVEVNTSFIRVGLNRMDLFRKQYPDAVIYGTGFLVALPAILRKLFQMLYHDDSLVLHPTPFID